MSTPKSRSVAVWGALSLLFTTLLFVSGIVFASIASGGREVPTEIMQSGSVYFAAQRAYALQASTGLNPWPILQEATSILYGSGRPQTSSGRNIAYIDLSSVPLRSSMKNIFVGDKARLWVSAGDGAVVPATPSTMLNTTFAQAIMSCNVQDTACVKAVEGEDLVFVGIAGLSPGTRTRVGVFVMGQP